MSTLLLALTLMGSAVLMALLGCWIVLWIGAYVDAWRARRRWWSPASQSLLGQRIIRMK